MGYTTDFDGSLKIEPALTEEQYTYLNTLFGTRRMRRDVKKLMTLFKGKYGNPFAVDTTPEAIYGREGEYFAKDDGYSGQREDASVIDHNIPPMQTNYGGDNFDGVPGLWCGWRIDMDGTVLEWDGGEKFYNYVEWMEYIMKHFFNPWGVKANGEILWHGEDSNDLGKIVVTDNVVKVLEGKIKYEE